MTAGLDAMLAALEQLLPDRVSRRPADLAAAAHDASSLPAARPDAVVWPLSTDDVVAVVRLASERAIPLTARGAGSSLEGNPIPVRGGIVLDCSRMTRVIAVRPEDLQVDVEPGVVYAALNRELRPHGLFFPPSPGGSADVATIGGMVANNASGIYSVKYGGTRDHVRAATVVTGTGELLRLGNRCRKSASGYHLLGLLVGSEGTLAIATELTLALAGRPAARRQGGFRFADATAAARATAELIRFGIDVAAVEFLDDRTIAALNRFGAFDLVEAPALLLEVHGSEAGVAEAWQAAEDVVRGTGGVPLVLPEGRDAWRSGSTRRVRSRRSAPRRRRCAPISRSRSARCRPWLLVRRRSPASGPLRSTSSVTPASASCTLSCSPTMRSGRPPRRRGTRSSTPPSRSAARVRVSTAWGSATGATRRASTAVPSA
ncbi:MAG: FAD-binding oxidoreductase [Deltaproteobacteria bacterium]|nr:MAG: FAD-binding oxidoreductase [Deltaproteobacteria bacterium]